MSQVHDSSRSSNSGETELLPGRTFSWEITTYLAMSAGLVDLAELLPSEVSPGRRGTHSLLLFLRQHPFVVTAAVVDFGAHDCQSVPVHALGAAVLSVLQRAPNSPIGERGPIEMLVKHLVRPRDVEFSVQRVKSLAAANYLLAVASFRSKQ